MSEYVYESDGVTDRSILAGRVKRYSCWPTITQQTVGCHTWSLYHIYWRIFGVPTAAVAFYIHMHDVPELVVGDNPFPSKMRFPALKEATVEAELAASKQLDVPATFDLTPRERHQVKVCDLLEMMSYGMQEREMGNLLATPIIERTRDIAMDIALRHLPSEDSSRVKTFVMNEVARHGKLVKFEGSTKKW